MNKIDMTFRCASSTAYVIGALLLFLHGEVASGILVSGLLYWTIAATLSDVKLAETRADLELALKREREYLYRAVKAEHDANVATLKTMFPTGVEVEQGDAE